MQNFVKTLKDWCTAEEIQELFNTDVKGAINDCERPERNDIFNAFDGLKPQDVKVLIIGQDPYPDKKGNKVAHGLAFSSKSAYCPTSLQKIFAEIESEYGKRDFKSNDLTCWKKQGVLLLNTALTYSENKSLDERLKIWKPFVMHIISKLLNYKQPLVIILWGKKAQKLFRSIDINNDLLILKSSHPQARRKDNTFFGCNHFKECNKFLETKKCKPIEWRKTYEVKEA